MYSKSFLFILFILITSCQFFDNKIPDEEELLQEELKKINWNEVDHYPIVFSCDSILDKLQQKECFFQFLTETIQAKIGIDTIQILYPQLDTLSVKVTINTDASVYFEIQKPTDSVSYNIQTIDSILQSRLTNFPLVKPAIKQGVKVKSQFVLPIIIKITEE